VPVVKLLMTQPQPPAEFFEPLRRGLLDGWVIFRTSLGRAMRTVRIIAASTLLATSAVVGPVVSVGAAPHAVRPSVERVPMPTGSPVVAASAARGAAPAASVESLLTRATGGADVVGVGFPDAAAARGASVTVRSMTGGHWGAWTPVPLSDSAPDPGTAEASRAKVATDPVGVTGSEQVQVRVSASASTAHLQGLEATFVDGGTSAADASLADVPAASASAAVVQPTIITRAQWGADESLRTCSSPDYVASIKGAVVHHTVNSNTYTAEAAPALLRSIYAYHITGNGWCDVGYNFFVDRFGRLYEGRFGGMAKNVVGAQTGGFNSQTFGVSSIGNHDPGTAGAVAPSSAVLTAIGKLIGWKAWLNGWSPDTSASFTSGGSTRWPAGKVITEPRVTGHRDYGLTVCPGDLMYSRLATVRSTATQVYKAGQTPTTGTAAVAVVETYTRPGGTSFSLAGRGYGHGRGMSQYGAYGAALKGLTRDQTLAFYYPNTTRSTAIGNPTVRVKLSALGSSSTQLVTTPNLVVSDGTKTGSLNSKNSDGTLRARWRVVPEGTGLTLQWLQAGTWRSTSSWKAVTRPLSFSDTVLGKVRVVMPDGTQRDYRRTIRSVRSGTGVMTLSVLSMNYYLQSVVPSEMPASWPATALQVQAVSARTYAAYEMAHQPAGSLYDVCDSTSCQVYSGLAGYTSSGTLVPHEYAASTAAVSATTGLGVFYGGAPAFTQFTSSNGGQTVASSLPYQVSKADPYDDVAAGSTSRWTTSISVSTIEKAYPAVGTLKALRIDKRDGYNAWGGRISSLTIVGSAGSKTVTGDSFRSTFGLRSPWWTVTSVPATSAASYPKDLDGNSRADLVAVDPGGTMRLLSGNGSGAFTAKSMGAGWAGRGLIADVGAWDGDNRHDVVERDAGTLYYHPGNGAGGFYARVGISPNWDTVNLVAGAGDLDGDHHTDFLARTTSGQLKVYRGDGAGKVLSTILVSSSRGWNDYRLVMSPGDLTGDGKLDVLAVRASDGAMLLFPGTGKGTVGTAVTVSGSWAGYSKLIGPGDVTGDGLDDVVGRRASDGALQVFAGNDMGGLVLDSTVSGTATWATWTTWPL
jgi:SpoIID/LytB domain protein